MAPATVSVVINSVDRAESLRSTLRALRHQHHRDFEVIVVEGPSDSPYRLDADTVAEGVRHLHCEVRNLPVSRNIGIAAAAGELVAFIDDDAIPEPRWLAGLTNEFSDPRVGGAGGITYDHTGTRMQYHYSRCDRLGRTLYDQQPVTDAEQSPGAEVFPYLQGTNMCFRRDVLEAVGGFDEGIGYVYDDVEICLRVIESGAVVRCVDGAAVYHKFLPSRVRSSARLLADPHLPVRDRAYFALRHGSATHSTERVLAALLEHVAEQRVLATRVHDAARYTDAELEFFVRRLDEGLRDGLLAGLSSSRNRPPVAPRDPGAFAAYRRLVPEDGRRLTICLLAGEHPPPAGGVASELAEVAERIAGRGHEVHVLARGGEHPDTLDFEEDCWVHRAPDLSKRVPQLAGSAPAGDLSRLAVGWHDALALDARQGVDLVLAPSAAGAGLGCALDPGLATVAVSAAPASDDPLARETEAHSRWRVSGDIGRGVTHAVAERAAEETEPERADVGERAVVLAAALAPILERAARLDPEAAAAAANRLLDPANHPFDLRAEIGAVWTAPARTFLTVLSRTLLRREPHPDDLDHWEPEVEHRGWRRAAGLMFACSVEAQSLGVDPGWVATLRAGTWPVDHGELAGRLRALWDGNGERFLTTGGELILGRAPDPSELTRGRERLAAGATRSDIVSWLAALPAARAREVRGRTLLRELGEEPDVLLRRAWTLDDTSFVERVHEIVLEREVEDDLRGQWAAQLAYGGTRLDHLHLIASSDEARMLARDERALAGSEPESHDPATGPEPWLVAIDAEPPSDPGPRLRDRAIARLRRSG